MSLLSSPTLSSFIHPLDLAEEIVHARHWPYDRCAQSELVVDCPGSWCRYDIYFAQAEKPPVVHFVCAHPLSFTPERRSDIEAFICLINNRLDMGHFAFDAQEMILSFRHSLPANVDPIHLENIIDLAIYECERFYPAFQRLIWGGQTPSEALEIALFDTVGQA